MDCVLDIGLARTLQEHDDVLEVRDRKATPAGQKQRMGRAGRVKPGGYVEFTWPENETRPVQIMDVESVARIVALREYPERIAPSRVMLCDLADLHCEQEKRRPSLYHSCFEFWSKDSASELVITSIVLR